MVGAPIRVGLFWHSARSRNLGVGALTVANMAIARAVAQEMGARLEFKIFSMRDLGPAYVGADEASEYVVDARRLLSPQGVWTEIGELDCVLDIGAGDSFADIYGLKRFIFLWLTKMMAAWRRTPLVLSPQTIGPFTKFPYVPLARLALNEAQAVVARDDMSLDALKALAPKAHGLLAVDVAFALPFEDGAAARNGPKARVGVNVSGLLYNEAVSGNNRFGLEVDYARLMNGFLEEMANRQDVELHLIRHAGDGKGGWDDDDKIAAEISLKYPGAIVAPSFESPSAAKSYISSLDFLVAGRMHACIAAFSAGVAVAPVAYSRKFAGLFGMLGYRWMVPVKGLDDAAALAFLLDCFERRAELAADTAKGMQRVSALLDVYRGALRNLFTGLNAKRA